MEPIHITQAAEHANGWEYTVVIGADNDNLSFHVTLTKNYYQNISHGKVTPENFVLKSFQFLLDREPRSSILRSFDLKEIERYFPEYPQTAMNWED